MNHILQEFNPFYFMEKIDKNKLKMLKSNPEWKLSVNFQDFYRQYEKNVSVLIDDVKVKEKELYEK